MDDILKPDTPGYDPYEFLAYDKLCHAYYPNPDIEDEHLFKRVDKMIHLLGLNYGTIKDNRILFLSPILERLSLGKKEDADVYQFVTAYQMCVQEIEEAAR